MIIRRVDELQVGEKIVLVAVSSERPQAALQGAQIVMDDLKNKAAISKKSTSDKGSK